MRASRHRERCSRLSASLTLLKVVNHPAQMSAAALFICCSYISSYLGCANGKDASRGARDWPSGARRGALSYSGKMPARKKLDHIRSFQLAFWKSINTKWIHFKSAGHPFYRTDHKGGVIGVHTTQSTNTLAGVIQSYQTMTFFSEFCEAQSLHLLSMLLENSNDYRGMIRIITYNPGRCTERQRPMCFFIYIFL